MLDERRSFSSNPILVRKEKQWGPIETIQTESSVLDQIENWMHNMSRENLGWMKNEIRDLSKMWVWPPPPIDSAFDVSPEITKWQFRHSENMHPNL